MIPAANGSIIIGKARTLASGEKTLELSRFGSLTAGRRDRQQQGEHTVINRRQFLRSSSGVVLSAGVCGLPQVLRAAPQAESELGKVKIVDVQTATIRFRYDMHLVKVITDSGLYGIGEAYNRGGVLDHIQNIKQLVRGEDPLMVDVLTQKMMDAGVGQGSFSGSLTGAISGIETALWDVAGKILNVPVYVLLGGRFRDKVLLYHDTGSPNTPDPKPWVEEAEKTREFGFRTTKFDLNPFGGERWNRAVSSEDLKAWIRILEAIRDYLGPDFPLGVDFHWKLNTHYAKQFVDMARHLNLWFVEDPMPPGNADAFVRLTASEPNPHCHRREPLHPADVSAVHRAAGVRHHPAGHAKVRWAAGNEEDR